MRVNKLNLMCYKSKEKIVLNKFLEDEKLAEMKKVNRNSINTKEKKFTSVLWAECCWLHNIHMFKL